ncbi:unnamed protein product [Agarophyton chilense]
MGRPPLIQFVVVDVWILNWIKKLDPHDLRTRCAAQATFVPYQYFPEKRNYMRSVPPHSVCQSPPTLRTSRWFQSPISATPQPVKPTRPQVFTAMDLAFQQSLVVLPRIHHLTRRSYRRPSYTLRRSHRLCWTALADQSNPSLSGGSGRSDDGSRDAEFNLDLSTQPEVEETNELFKIIKQVPPPDLVKKFTETSPPVVQNAIRETLVSMLGSLPPLAFATSVSTMSSNLVQLFHSSLVTGYMFRNATYRMELTRSLDWSGIRALPSSEKEPPKIEGGVAVFKQNDGSEVEVPVEEYISELRQTVTNLKGELERERKGGNELLSFIATMEKENIEALTKNAGDEVVDAMKKVVQAVTKSQGISMEKDGIIHAATPDLGQLLFYLMVSGFFLREAEVHLDLQRKLGGDPSSITNLLGGTEKGPDDSDGKSSQLPKKS